MITVTTADRSAVRARALLAASLGLSLIVGFAAGQAAPDLMELLSSATTKSATPARPLTLADDYGIRHLVVPIPSSTLSRLDDYATRHAFTPSVLTPLDDYALRH